MPPRVTAAAAFAALVIAPLVILGIASPATAHSEIVDSVPAPGETLTSLPDEFSVKANEDLAALPEGFALDILDADGQHYESGQTVVDGPTLSTPAAIGAAGEYRLVYQVVSNDGHPVSGEIPFTWSPGGAGTSTAQSSEPTADPLATTAPIARPGEPATPGGAGMLEGPWFAIAIAVPVVLVLAVGIVVGVAVRQRRRDGSE